MTDGFYRVAAVTPRVTPGDPGKNTDEIIRYVKELSEKNVNIAVFPELSITGYSCGDMFLQGALIKKAEDEIHRLASETTGLDVLFWVGAPMVKGGKLKNAAVCLYKGNILATPAKTYIPNYNEFYEARYFTPDDDKNPALVRVSDKVFCAAEICEDLWLPDPPSNNTAQKNALILCNLSASNAVIGKDIYRRDLVKMQSAKTISAYIYANAGKGESTTDTVYDGHSFIAENGVILAESKRFEEGYIIADIDTDFLMHERIRMNTFRIDNEETAYADANLEKHTTSQLLRQYPKYPFVPSEKEMLSERCEYILEMQSHGLAKRLSAIHAKTAVIGLSGGLDSTLALLVTVRAFDILNLPKSGIIAITMPCFGTTSRTKSNAEKLGEAYGTDFHSIDITEAVKLHFRDIGLPDSDRSAAFENCQARERTQILMDTANMTGGIVIGTGDLSELALGFATYNGDHMSMYGVNAGVPKTLVRYLVRFVRDTSNAEIAAVLDDILNTPVSPELLPADEGSQHTEEIVGPYELHDFFLYYFVRCAFSPQKILRIAIQTWGDKYPAETIDKWLHVFIKRFFSQQFKRSCLPDGVKIGSVSLSPRADFRMPSDMSYEFLGYI